MEFALESDTVVESFRALLLGGGRMANVLVQGPGS